MPQTIKEKDIEIVGVTPQDIKNLTFAPIQREIEEQQEENDEMEM